ncbi:Bifunctional F420 biosynthesis protein FbiB [Candidatus Entotheonellaceae bacterium PAL068K]
MQVSAIKTHQITIKDTDIYAILERYISSFEDQSILVVTSKIVSICQQNIVKIGDSDKKHLIEQEADYFLPSHLSKHNITLTIKNNILLPTSGIDESNGNGYYILWPKEPQNTADAIRRYLQKRFVCQRPGVIITDSKTTPLRAGVTGVAIAHSGFLALNDYIGTMDIFGHTLRMTRVDVANALATAAVLVMGEGNEQTPLAVIRNLPFVTFQDRAPSAEELQQLRIDPEEDLYAPLLQGVRWQQ